MVIAQFSCSSGGSGSAKYNWRSNDNNGILVKIASLFRSFILIFFQQGVITDDATKQMTPILNPIWSLNLTWAQ